MKRNLVAVLLMFAGCLPQRTQLESKLIPPDRLHFSSPWSIAGVAFWSPAAYPNLKDSTEIATSVTLSPGFHLGEMSLTISFDTLLVERSPGTLRVSGCIRDRQSGETVPGVRVLHLRPYEAARFQGGEKFTATPLACFVSDAAGRFAGTLVVSEGDLIAFDALGYVATFCCVDPVLR
jgi:hypothetical protein